MIPEELTKMSDKELKDILSEDNPFKAKYFYDKEDKEKLDIFKAYNTKLGKILEVNRKISRDYIYNDNDDEVYINPSTFSIELIKYKELPNSCYVPLTYKDYKNNINKDVVSYLKNLSLDKFQNYIKGVISIFFDKENIEIQKVNENYFDIIVYIPEIKITNSIELDHIMRDVYLKFAFQEKFFTSLFIARTTFYDMECVNNYVFSHLNGRWNKWSRSLCFGDTKYSNVYSMCRDYNLRSMYSYFSQFVAGLMNYLSWESLEGKPYKYIADIYSNSSNSIASCPSYTAENMEKIYLDFILNIKNVKYTFTENNGMNSIKLDEDYKRWLHEEISKYSEEKLLFTYSEGKSYTNVRKYTEYLDYNGKDSHVTFKGEVKKYKIEPFKEIKESKKLLHITIFNKFVDELEKSLTNFIIQKK